MRMRTGLSIGLALLLTCSVALAQEPCTAVTLQTPARVNMEKVRAAWLRWTNDARKAEGLEPYALDETLNMTAGNWSTYAVMRGSIDHKRSAKAGYYDYGKIEQWFDGFDVTFPNIHGATFTENIGWGVFRCPRKQDCTEKVIGAIRTTFDFYMGEKGKKNDAHYASIMKNEFRFIGVGVAVSPAQGRYYLTVHYATDVNLEGPPLCKK